MTQTKVRNRLYFRPLCFSCGKPTKALTKTVYGLLPFCMICGNIRRDNQSKSNHVLYGKNFKTTIDNENDIISEHMDYVKISCFSCGKIATDDLTDYDGLEELPFCSKCAESKQEKTQSPKHEFYGKNFQKLFNR